MAGLTGRHVLSLPQIQFTTNLHNISTRVEKIDLQVGQKSVDATAFGDGWETWLQSQISHWMCKLDFFVDFTTDTTGDTFNEFKALLLNGVPVQLTVYGTTGLIGQANGNVGVQGTVVLDSDFPIYSAHVGQVDKGTITLKGTGALSFLTSSSS